MSKRMWPDRSAVAVVRAEEAFIPSSPWNFPQTFTDGRIVTLNIPLEDARAMVRSMNKQHMVTRQADPTGWDHQWAICVACPKDKGLDRLIRVRSASVQRKAGAA